MTEIEREVARALLREYGWAPNIVQMGNSTGFGGWERIARTALEAAARREARERSAPSPSSHVPNGDPS